MRQGIKDFTDWPTIPQLYINGEFVGGCDIAREMYESGELKALLEKNKWNRFFSLLNVYLPVADVTVNLIALIAIGVSTGLLAGMFGLGEGL